MRSAVESRLAQLGISPFAAGAAVAAWVFIGVSIYWLAVDRHVHGGDGGRHLAIVLTTSEMLRSGDLGSILELGPNLSSFYPPLVHVIGAVPAALGLETADWAVVALNLVFVPLLAAGCYLTGRLVYGPLAGMLAAIFALGTPIVLSLFHDFLLDAPLAAMIAISTWALLASDRFAERRTTVLAGALIGAALLIKPIAPIYLVGPILVMLIGGGWRQGRNLAFGAAALLVVAGPYYVMHLGDVLDVTDASTTAGGIAPAGEFGDVQATNPRFTPDALAWYGWAAINNQYYLPLIALLVVGIAAALSDLRRRAHLPELLAGLVGSYLLTTVVPAIRDPRYTIPMLVFVAVLATGWIAASERLAVRRGALAVLGIAVTLNLGATITDRLPTLRVVPPGSEIGFIDRGSLTILDDRGYTVGPPRRDPFWDRLLAAAEQAEIRTARLDVRETLPWGGSDGLGFEVAAADHQIEATTEAGPDPDLRISSWWTPAGRGNLPRPCGTVAEGFLAPDSDEPVEVSVAVERRQLDGAYRRWCGF